MGRFLYKIKRIVKLGLRSIVEHKLRSFLTALGIIFGVGSVIAMLSIGEGASFEAREQIRSLGSSNVIINSIKPADSGSSSGHTSRLSTYGLVYEDVMRIRELYPRVQIHVPAREIKTRLRYRSTIVPGRVIGTVPWALERSPIRLLAGRFLNEFDIAKDENVVVLGENAAKRLFQLEYPIGKVIRISAQAYEVIGIVAGSTTGGGREGRPNMRTPNRTEKAPGAPPGDAATAKDMCDVYIPITAARRRFGEIIVSQESGTRIMEKVELHQLTLTAETEAEVLSLAASVRATLRQTHKVQDFEIVVPLELLKQAEQTKRIFNIVLGSIAAISLLVGGIGIMNIMLASVTERTREIGIRRALGATRGDIVVQFLTEALLLSVIGGCIGIALGIAVPKMVTHFAGLMTIVQADSIFLAFTISLMTGIIFGIYPAIRAAALSPIDALRHE